MYSSLTSYGQSCSATNKHYPCVSLAIPYCHSKPRPSLDMSLNVLPIRTFTEEKEELPPQRFSGEKSLLPIMNPSFNLREICKQCILLEDHLTHEEKRCTDCCQKHFLTIEGFAEEAMTLDKTGEYYQYLKDLPSIIRNLQIEWQTNPNKAQFIAQKLREIRKQFQNNSFNVIQSREGCQNGNCGLI